MIGSRLVTCLNKLLQVYPCKYIPRYSTGCGNPDCKNPKCPGKLESDQSDPCCSPCPSQPDLSSCPEDPPCPDPKPPCPNLKQPCCPKDPPCCPEDPPCPPKPNPCCPPKPPCCPEDPPGPPKPNPCCPPKPPCCPEDPPCPPKPTPCPPKPPGCPSKAPPCPPKPPACPPKPPSCPKDLPCPPKPRSCPPKPPCCPEDLPCPPKPPRCPPKPPCPPKPKKQLPCPCPPKPPCKAEAQKKPKAAILHPHKSSQPVGSKSDPCCPKPCKSDCSSPKSCSDACPDVDKAAKEVCVKALKTCAEARKLLAFYRSQKQRETKETDVKSTNVCKIKPSGDTSCKKQQEQKTKPSSNNTSNKENQAPHAKQVNSVPKIYNADRSLGKKVGQTKSPCLYCKNASSICSCTCSYCKKDRGVCPCHKESGSKFKITGATPQYKKHGQGKSQASFEQRTSSQSQVKSVTCLNCKQTSQLGICKSLTVHDKNAGSNLACDGTCPLGKSVGSLCACIRQARERVKAQFANEFKTSENKRMTKNLSPCKKEAQQSTSKKLPTPSVKPCKKPPVTENKTTGSTCLLLKKTQRPCPRVKSAAPISKCGKSQCGNVAGGKLKTSESKPSNVNCPRRQSAGGSGVCVKLQGPHANASGSASKVTRSPCTSSKKVGPCKPQSPSESKSIAGCSPSKIVSHAQKSGRRLSGCESKTTCSKNQPSKTADKNAGSGRTCIKLQKSNEMQSNVKYGLPCSKSSLHKTAEQKNTTSKSQTPCVRLSGSELKKGNAKFPLHKKASHTGMSRQSQALCNSKNLQRNSASVKCDETCPLGNSVGIQCTCIKAQRLIGSLYKLSAAKSQASLEKLSVTKTKSRATCPSSKKASHSSTCIKPQGSGLKRSGSESQMNSATCSICKQTKVACACQKSQSQYAKKSGSQHKLATIKSQVSCDTLAGKKSKKCDTTCPLGKTDSKPCTCIKSQKELHGAENIKQSESMQTLTTSKSQTLREKLDDKSKKFDTSCSLRKKSNETSTCTISQRRSGSQSRMIPTTCPLCKKGEEACTCLQRKESRDARKTKMETSTSKHKCATAKTQTSKTKLADDKSRKFGSTCPLCKTPDESCTCGKPQRPYAKQSNSQYKMEIVTSQGSFGKLSKGSRNERSGNRTTCGTCPLCKKDEKSCKCLQSKRSGGVLSCSKTNIKQSASGHKITTGKSQTSYAKLAEEKSKKFGSTCPLCKTPDKSCTCGKPQRPYAKQSNSQYKMEIVTSQGSFGKLSKGSRNERSGNRTTCGTCPLCKKDEKSCKCLQSKRSGGVLSCSKTNIKQSASGHKITTGKSQTSYAKLAEEKSKKFGSTCPLCKTPDKSCTCGKPQRPYAKQSNSQYKMEIVTSQGSFGKLSKGSRNERSGNRTTCGTCPLCKKDEKSCKCLQSKKSGGVLSCSKTNIKQSASGHKITTGKSQTSYAKLAEEKPKKFGSTCQLCKKAHGACTCRKSQKPYAKASQSQYKMEMVKSQGSCGNLSKGSRKERSNSQSRMIRGTCPLCKKVEESCTCLQSKTSRTVHSGSSKIETNNTVCQMCRKTKTTCTCKTSQKPSEKQYSSRAYSTSEITFEPSKASHKVGCSCCKLHTLYETDSATPCQKCQKASKQCIEFLCAKYKRMENKSKLALRASFPCSKVSSPCYNYNSRQSSILCTQPSVYMVPTSLSQRLGIKILSSRCFSSKSERPPCGKSESECNKQTPSCSRKPDRPCRMPGPCCPTTQRREDPCGEGAQSCGAKEKSRCDLLCQLQNSVFRDQPPCERQQLNQYFGNCYQNKEYHMYNKETFHELQIYMKNYRNRQPSNKKPLPKRPCSDRKQ